MERVVIKRRGGILPTEMEIWIGEQRIEGIVGYKVEERYKMVPQITFTVECEELIEELSIEGGEIRFEGVRDAVKNAQTA
jgi:hypothetical protein